MGGRKRLNHWFGCLVKGALMDVINFCRISDEFGQFSNLAPFPINLDGERWPTSEHYFQAQKFEDDAYRQKIRKTNSPTQAARLGRDRKQKLRRDWESVKVGIMRQAMLAKFTQHEEPRTLLLSTGEAKIVEHTENDDYWGDGGDGSGKNMLGRILMEVREQVRAD
jgi:N-glycosidase YbiA